MRDLKDHGQDGSVSEGARALGRREFLALAAGAPTALGAFAAAASDQRATLLPIPYYSERSDLDAGVACARMALGYFEPEEHSPCTDVAEMVCHREGFWTFEAQLIPILLQKGCRAVLQAQTPYAELAAGKAQERYGAEAGKRIDREALQWALPYLKEENFQERPAVFDEALEWFDVGDLVVLAVSRQVLRHAPSLPYCRYNVVLTGHAGNTVRYHDPAAGPHRQADVAALRAAFEAAGTDRAALRIGRK